MLIVLRGNAASGKSTVVEMQRRLHKRAPMLHTRLRTSSLDIWGCRDAAKIAQTRTYAAYENEHLTLDSLQPGSLRQAPGTRDPHIIDDPTIPTPVPPPETKLRPTCAEDAADLAAASDDARFYAFDLTFEETARRHATRLKVGDFSAEEMASWYHGWQPLDFVAEHRITAAETPEEVVERILLDA